LNPASGQGGRHFSFRRIGAFVQIELSCASQPAKLLFDGGNLGGFNGGDLRSVQGCHRSFDGIQHMVGCIARFEEASA
jgi:hypothetical protein